MAPDLAYSSGETVPHLLEIGVGELLAAAASERPEHTALIEGVGHAGRRWSYRELHAQAVQVAHGLLDRFDPGDRVGLCAPNVPEWEVLEFGAALAGICIVTINPAYRPTELTYVLRQSRAAGVIHADEHRGASIADAISAARSSLPDLHTSVSLSQWEGLLGRDHSQDLPAVDPGSAFQIQYTSGTSGTPKGAVISHRSVVNNAVFCMRRCEADEDSVLLGSLPMFHTGGCVFHTLGAVACRGTHVLLSSYEPGLVLDLIEQRRVTIMCTVPTIIKGLMAHPTFRDRDLSSMRTLIAGGTTIPQSLMTEVQTNLGCGFSVIYGQTEAGPSITLASPHDAVESKAETVGRVLPHTEVKIVDPDTLDPVPLGGIGELHVRGHGVMRGYYDMPDATAEAIRPDGWLRTGDLATMDADGFVRITGRLKDMIIRGGENIYPREIEEVLRQHPSVADVAVVGRPDDVWGEQVAAFVKPGAAAATPAQLAAFVGDHLARHKVPRYIGFVDEFPLTASGKVQKFVLKDRAHTLPLITARNQPPAARGTMA